MYVCKNWKLARNVRCSQSKFCRCIKLQKHSYCGSKRAPASSNANARLASQPGRFVRVSRAGSLISGTTLIGDQLGSKRHVPYGF